MTTTAISRDELYSRIRECLRNSYQDGRHWHYVRVWPDGSIVVGREVSKCLPESEYYGRRHHPVTVWEVQANYRPEPDDGLFVWDDCEHDSDAQFFTSEDGEHWCWPQDRDERPECTQPKRWGDWSDQCDFTHDYHTAEERLSSCEWFTLED